MSQVVYSSHVTIHRLGGRLRSATVPAEDQPVLFGVHGAVAEQYHADPALEPPHATTLDYVVAAAGG